MLYGYKPRTRKAPWLLSHPSPQPPATAPSRPMAPWTRVPGAKVAEPKARKLVRAVSKRRQKVTAEYVVEARLFVEIAKMPDLYSGEQRTCPVVAAVTELRNGKRYGWPVSSRLNEVHHKRGRAGSLLMDTRFWLAVSKAGHRWIHSNPAKARKLGFLCPAGLWNVPHRPGMCLGCGCDVHPSCEWCGECLCEVEGND